MLTVKNLNTHYGNIHALKGIDLEVAKGEIVTLIGSNGAGKTTT
jgi:branched-chain amino acid transport system ATP-binding protein